jgi:putative ABC transport system permease protein
LIGVLLGCGASLLGGAFPLLDLSRTDPIQALRGRVAGRRGIRVAKKAAWVGLAVFLISLAILPATAINVYVGFASAFGCLLAGSLFAGTVLVVVVPLLKWCFSRLSRLPGKVAAGNIHQNLGRTAVAVAAFMVALSMAIGLGSMIDSFRKTLVWWMGSQLRGDLYIAPSREVGVPAELLSELQRMTGIGGLDPYRNVQVIFRDRTVRITAIDAGVLQKYTEFGWLKGGNENWNPVKKGDVIVSESFHRRFDVGAGDTISLESIRGPTALRVAAVFYDYTTEHGLIMMDRSTYIELYDDTAVDSLVVFMDPDNPHREKILEEVKKRAARWGIPVAPREKFHAAILEVFDATFAVTRSMRLLAVIVAFFGIAGALLTLFMERQREFGVYRALGFSTGQAAVMTFMEGLGMGLVSFVLSVGVGTVLALILIRAINLHSFHWTIFFYPDWGPYLLAAGTAVLASVGAAAYPIWRVCRTYPQIQIREE